MKKMAAVYVLSQFVPAHTCFSLRENTGVCKPGHVTGHSLDKVMTSDSPVTDSGSVAGDADAATQNSTTLVGVDPNIDGSQHADAVD